jgi:alkylhydroperoxidase family enzyme
MTAELPRIAPGGRRQIGTANWVLARLLGLATGGGPPNVFTTLARHRGLFRRWLWFAAALMPGGRLPRADSERVILRVADNCACEYERVQHERLALVAGLSAEEVQRVRQGPDAEDRSPRQRLLLRAADALHAERTISAELWQELSGKLSEIELIELCMLTGHYEMLAMTLNALAVAPDELTSEPPAALRLAQKLLERRRPAGGIPR